MVLKGFGMIFAAIGALMLTIAGAAHIMQRQGFADGVAVKGRVIAQARQNNSDTYAPVVVFMDQAGDRREFVDSVGTGRPRYAVGEDVDVIYRASNPDAAAVDDFLGRNLFQMIFGGIGLVFVALGAGLWIPAIRREVLIKTLKRSGIKIDAEFVETYQDGRIQINGRSPFRVVAQGKHPRTGKMHRFESEMLWVNPAEMLKGKRMTVLADPRTPKKHYVDLSGVIADY